MTDQIIHVLLIEPKVQRASRIIGSGHHLQWTHVLWGVDAVDTLDQANGTLYAILYPADHADITEAHFRRLQASGIPLLRLHYQEEQAITIDQGEWPYQHYVPLHHAQTDTLLESTIRGLVENSRLQTEQSRIQQHYADMERQFSTMVADNPDGILIMNASGRVVFANQQAANIFDTTINGLIGREFGYPLTVGEMTSLTKSRQDGSMTYVEMQASETTWQGQPAMAATLHDVTARKLEEQKLYQTRLLHVSVFNSITERVAVVDKHGYIIAINQAWQDAARRNGDPELKYTGIGADYFGACRNATGEMSEGAGNALVGMLDVLQGRRGVFEMEYQDIEQSEPEWFMMRVTRLTEEFDSGLVVVHANISFGKRTAREQAESEAALSQYERRQRELATLSDMGRVRPAPARPPANVLRENSPDIFEDLVQRFQNLLNRAFEQRTHKIADSLSDDLRHLADYLGTMRVGPREVMDLYLTALKRATNTAPSPKVQAYTEEGRILILELMGYLVTFYRDALPPTVRLSPA